jgi:hypothetical protein
VKIAAACLEERGSSLKQSVLGMQEGESRLRCHARLQQDFSLMPAGNTEGRSLHHQLVQLSRGWLTDRTAAAAD